MTHNSPKQHTLWLLAALAAPAAHFSGSGWLMTALASAAALPLMLLPKSWEVRSGAAVLVQVLWLGLTAGFLLPGSAACWPSDNDRVVPLTLLTLAALTPWAAAPRIGAVLAFCMALLALPAAVSGASHIEPEFLEPAAAPWPVGLGLTLLLPNLPAAEEGHRGRRLLSCGAMAVLLSVLVQGVLSTQVASRLPDPFHQTARALGHMEPIIASALTLGWYALAAWMFSSAERIAEGAGIREKNARVLLWGTATGMVILRWQLNGLFLTVLSLFLWVIAPFFQKMKKVKKGA